MIRVAIYADTVSRAQWLAKLLAEDERLEVLQARAAIRVSRQSPMTDVVVAAGLRAEDLFGEGPPVVLLSREPPHQAAFTGPVRAWLPDDALPAEISAAVIAAAQDLTVLTHRQVRRWLKSANEDEQTPTEALTPRELQVLRMLADGLGNKQIAAQLAISDHTAKFHVAQILAKLRAVSRAEAVAIAMRRGLVPI
ncbi:MAG TPA: response regulator transcription factor [Bryobacteraceae bacterium]|nr:response regulator transcription factor [Bryobacteraceae bacterium]